MLRDLWTFRCSSPVLRQALIGCGLSWIVAGCGSPSTGDTPHPAQVQLDAEGPEVRWARGFGWTDGGRILWLADAQDTTYWTQSRQVAEIAPRGTMLLPPPYELAIGTWSTTHVPFVRAIGAEAQWVACGYADRIVALPEKVVNLGGDAGLEEEMVVASGVNVLTSYPFGNPMEGVTDRTGVTVLPLTEYAEPHPLGRAEYLRLFGWLTGRDSAADGAFDQIEAAYLAMAAQAEAQAVLHGRPVVFSGSSQSGRWTAPGAEGMVAKLIADAGGEYAFNQQVADALGLKKIGANYEVELEQCAAIAAGSDLWGKVVHAPEGWTMDEAKAEAPWCDFEHKALFHCNTAEVDYFGQAVLEPHVMLADLYALFHGVGGNRTPVYFKPTSP